MDLITATNALVTIAITLGGFSLREMYRHNALLEKAIGKDSEHDAAIADIRARQAKADAEIEALRLKVAQLCAAMGVPFSE